MNPASGVWSPTINFKSTLLPDPLRPRTATASPLSVVRSMPFSTFCPLNDFRRPWRTSGSSSRRRACAGSFVCLRFLSFPIFVPSRKERDHQTYQHYVRENDEQRRQNHGAGGRPPYTLRATSRAHALKASHRTNDQPKHHRLQRGWKKISECHVAEPFLDEKPEGDWLC